MLYQFLATHRHTLIDKSVEMAAPQGPRNDQQKDSYGRISIFLDQLIDILRLEELAGEAPDYAESADDSSPIAAR